MSKKLKDDRYLCVGGPWDHFYLPPNGGTLPDEIPIHNSGVYERRTTSGHTTYEWTPNADL